MTEGTKRSAVMAGMGLVNQALMAAAYTLLWNWFVATTFGVPRFTVLHGFWLGLVIASLRPIERPPTIGKSAFEIFFDEAYLTYNYLVAIGGGWAAHYLFVVAQTK